MNKFLKPFVTASESELMFLSIQIGKIGIDGYAFGLSSFRFRACYKGFLLLKKGGKMMISDKKMKIVFEHYGKKYNKEIDDVLIAYYFGNITGIKPFLPTKDECRKKIESLQSIIKKLKIFIRKNRYTNEEIENLNSDINCFWQGEAPTYVIRQYKPIKKERKKRAGFIYFLQEHTGKVKIGKTQSLRKRILDLGIKFPIQPTLIHYFSTEDITASERQLHKKYQKYRLEGEWFKLSKREIEKIKTL